MQIRNGLRAYTVGELTRYIKTILTGQATLQNIAVSGEVSNLRYQQSGHVYFSLKDAASTLHCVMFRSAAMRQRFRLESGMKVWVRGSIGVYEISGQYQLYVDMVEPDGQGALYIAFEQLKAKLAQEGLLDPARKRPLPLIPKGVGIVTSPTGAAIRDLLSIIRRRFPTMPIVISPALVQGADAPASICRALSLLERCDAVDVIIVARGGGSLEDLWCFNDEQVARAIAGCRYPVISAVGHETDFTIADFVADVRAATPSAAAEIVVPEYNQLKLQCLESERRLTLALDRWLAAKRQEQRRLTERLFLNSPVHMVQRYSQRVDELLYRGSLALTNSLTQRRTRLSLLSGQLHQLSPLATLARGYTVVRKDLRVIRSVAQVTSGDDVEVVFQDGTARCVVRDRISEQKELGK